MTRRNVWRSILTSTLLALAALGCAEEKKNNGGFVGADAPEMITDVSELVFVEISQGESDTQTVNILNVGQGDLRISSVKLFESTTTDSGSEFSKGADWVNALALQPGESFNISVTYEPRDKQPDEGWIELATNDPKYEEGIAKIPLRTPGLAPRVYSKQTITFRRVPPVTENTRDKFWQLTTVENIGSAPLQVNDLVIVPGNSEFHVSFPETLDIEADPAEDAGEHRGTLDPGESFPMRVFFNPVDDLPAEAQLLIYSNDPQSPDYTVNLIGNSGAPCIQLNEEEELNFGEGAIGYANNKTVVMENCSPTSDLKVSDITVCTDDGEGTCDSAIPTFGIKEGSLPEGLPDAEFILGPQETSTFVLTYTPEGLEVSTGRLLVVSDDPAKEQLLVPIVGKGTDNQCPQAVAKAKLPDTNRWQNDINTIPLKTVQFSAADSIDSDGMVDSYEWNIIQRPNGSTAQFAPANTVPEPSLFIDLAGEYVVELKVFDERGTESCGEQALITIHAVPNETLHIQLVWNTPGDPDESDLYGSDVDLHLLHPNGTWDEGPYDVYWLNSTADWGVPGDPSDDPSLDIDDTDGAGPENINLDGPEVGLEYEVGVFYYSDAGLGPAYATVRVFIDGTQRYEKEQLLQDSKTFWHVGTIAWPAAQVNPTDFTRDNFP